jgi:hypothetical protein
MSGAYETRDSIPGGVTADAYYPKGYGSPQVLLRILQHMIEIHAMTAPEHPRQTAAARLRPS